MAISTSSRSRRTTITNNKWLLVSTHTNNDEGGRSEHLTIDENKYYVLLHNGTRSETTKDYMNAYSKEGKFIII
jgi:hypothetical protein